MKLRGKKIAMLLGMAMALSTVFPKDAMAATKDDWQVYYEIGVPTNIANPIDYLYVTYDAAGFIAHCEKLEGPINRWVQITAENAGGMVEQPIMRKGSTGIFNTFESIKGDVKFKVRLYATSSSNSSGYIKQAQ